jgi:DNA repair protein RecN (Recombination protein N)
LKVSKRDEGKVSVARINLLNEEQRIEELAKMLSGDPPTEAAVLNAKELINQ